MGRNWGWVVLQCHKCDGGGIPSEPERSMQGRSAKGESGLFGRRNLDKHNNKGTSQSSNSFWEPGPAPPMGAPGADTTDNLFRDSPHKASVEQFIPSLDITI